MENFQQTLQKAAQASTASKRYRFLVVNEHYLGHVTVHRLFCQALEADPEVDFKRERDTVTLDTVDNLLEKVQRRLASQRFGSGWMKQQGLDLGRWRFQRFVALLARKRVLKKLHQAEKDGRPYHAIAFHSQTAAFACGDIMARIPSLISTDITNAQAATEWNSPSTRWTYWPSTRWERAAFHQASGIATFSDWTRKAIMSENPGLDPGRVRHHPPGVDLAPFLGIPLERPFLNKLQLLFVGGDFERKGGPDVVACFERHLRQCCDLHVVSNGAPEGLADKGITVYRNLAPYSPELLERYRQADVFVLPTRNEAYGHVFIEAMAAGLPVIATHINAIPEIVPDAGKALLLRPGDQDGLKTAILNLSADLMRRRHLAELGRQRAIEQFDARACFGRYVAWLKEIAKKKS